MLSKYSLNLHFALAAQECGKSILPAFLDPGGVFSGRGEHNVAGGIEHGLHAVLDHADHKADHDPDDQTGFRIFFSTLFKNSI